MIYQMNGHLMSGDDAIAKIEQGHIVPIQSKRLPFYFQRCDDLYGWLEKRAVDKHRTNSRLIKRLARLSGADDPDVSMLVYAATITDNYWVRPDGCSLTYADVRFKANPLAATALYGDRTPFSDGTWKRRIFSPEFTNIGSFEKCWIKENGVWWMCKCEDRNAQFAELFMCQLAKVLGIPAAEYVYENGYVKSKDITNNAAYNLDLAYGLVLENSEDYSLNYAAFCRLATSIAQSYVMMLYFDALCRNVDRHTENYGVLRNPLTGKAVCFAPLFDHNLALFVQDVSGVEQLPSHDLLIADFVDFIKEKEIAFNQPLIEADTLRSIAQTVAIPYNTEAVVSFVLARQNEIQRELSLCQNYTRHICTIRPSVLAALREKQEAITVKSRTEGSPSKDELEH